MKIKLNPNNILIAGLLFGIYAMPALVEYAIDKRNDIFWDSIAKSREVLTPEQAAVSALV